MAACSSQRRCRPFTLAEIEKATDSFNGANFLGRGGEGMVFKGVLGGRKGTSYVAVKRLERLDSGEYEKEIKMLSELDHDNLVSLVGYCQQSTKKILVYEFMPNGSLRDNLCRKQCSLSWEQRLNICIGAARGLEYLHTRTSLANDKIIHRDVKPDNILLDENFAAKISDFGLSKRVPANKTDSWVSTALGRGTRGYKAPEYELNGKKITWRVDVYAFGVVLFEVLCKKKPWEKDDNTVYDDESYGKWAQLNVDPDLKGAISQSCLEAFTDIAEKCLRDHPDQRPSMNEVVSKLNQASKLQKSSSRSVANGEKRRVDSGGSSSESPDFEKTLGHGDFRRSKSAKFEQVGDDSASGESAKWELTRQDEGNKSTVEFGNSTKACKEIKPRLETQAYKSSGVMNELGSRDDKYSYPTKEDGKIPNDFNSEGETTNKEDMRRDDSNASGSSRILPDIPGTEDKVVLYFCTSGAVTDYMTTLLYLKTYKVVIEERDPTMNEEYQVELSRFFTQQQSKFSLPQLFIGGKHIGGANEVVRLHDSGELGLYLAVFQH